MKSERVRSEVERIGYAARRHPLRPGLHEQTEHIEAIVLRKSGQGRHGV